MSATGRGGVRITGERYYTDPRLTAACVSLLPIRPGQRVLEGHIGAGAWVEPLRQRGAIVYGMDINPEASGLRLVPPARRRVGDFLTAEPPIAAPDWIVGNPPFSRPLAPRPCSRCKPDTPKRAACRSCHGTGIVVPMQTICDQHVARALAIAKVGVAFILRAGFYETAIRGRAIETSPLAWFRGIPERPSFMPQGRGTDSCPYAFIQWERGHIGVARFELLWWKEAA